MDNNQARQLPRSAHPSRSESDALRIGKTIVIGRSNVLGRMLTAFKVDFTPRDERPSTARLLAASIVSIVGSLVVDAVLVAIGTRLFPSTKGYSHFQFSDYAKLTIVGVAVACVAWPIVLRISSAPRWLFWRLAIVVTLVLLLPDLYILIQGEPVKAVFVLVLMHIGIALVTYLALVNIGGSNLRRR